MATQRERVSLWAVEVLVAVAEEGAITAVARRLGVSASAVSQQLVALEAALGADLVDRSARPMKLTAAGTAFLPHAGAMLDALAQGRGDIAGADHRSLRHFRLGMIEDFEHAVTPQLLRDMAQTLTSCRFELETGPSHRLLSKLEARALDVVVAAAPHAPAADGLQAYSVLQEPFLEVWPDNRMDADLPLIRYSQRTLMGRVIAQYLAQHSLTPPSRYEMDSYPAILSLVAAGQGWTILTPSALHHGARSGLTLRPMRRPGLTREISVFARAGMMADLAQMVARHLQTSLMAQIVSPAIAQNPWLHGHLRVPQDL
ncbi:hypothetical protein BFP70_11520 [Thioclava sp. SK-1]|uniref:LysR family transcriptional regulator n=1 Tax=Thioclava sp. SK-1 TaxID=1889770 RepID=UPI000826EFE2|nr:LysR family transcriptional regulator [Thioclava sp. SK-1]OCX64714.1 hypothetical protein BFP70_11520 [Thioclava sp. SK-1]